jgi:hypothetical protein
MHPRLVRFLRLARQVREEILSSGSFSDDLGGCCGFVSKYLVLLSVPRGFHPTLVHGIQHYLGQARPSKLYPHHCDHAWVLYYRHVVDLTATQYGEKEGVVVVPDSDSRYTPILVSKSPYLESFHADWLFHPLQSKDPSVGENGPWVVPEMHLRSRAVQVY